jgi:hypothetical protein
MKGNVRVTGALKSKGFSGPTYRKEEDISRDERRVQNCQTPYPLRSKCSKCSSVRSYIKIIFFIF